MATPHVAGAAALVMSETGQTPSQVRATLKNSATDDVDEAGRKNCVSQRHLNLSGALGGGGGSTTPPPSTSPGAIAGYVSDARAKTALASATVDCGTAGVATTGSDGRYSLTNVAPAAYTCTASKTGYASKSASVSVASGATSTADFALRAR
jgi:subtilisin family serine protease